MLERIINNPEFKKVCLLLIPCQLAKYLPIEYLLYNALILFLCALSIILIKSALVRFSFFLLFLYSLSDHVAATMYAASGDEIYYQLQIMLFDFYTFLFYGTLCLIFAGLAKGNSGGRHERNYNKRFDLFRLRFLAGARV